MEELATTLASINPFLLLAIILWTIPWKMWALWLSARRGDFWWFVVIILFSSLAILEIFYIFFIAKQKDR